MARRLHIYNIDTDFALAAKSDFYTPPAKIARIRAQNALFPATYARPGDAILLLPSPGIDFGKRDISRLPFHDIVSRKGLDIITAAKQETAADLSGHFAFPWGWNRVIRRFLADRLPSLRGIKTPEETATITRLSHRRTTIAFHRAIRSPLAEGIAAPCEYFSAEEAMEAYHRYGDIFFKTPWSSSGRGIQRTNDLEDMHVEPWLRGAIARQGSVMGEIALDNALDFATEWYVAGDEGDEDFPDSLAPESKGRVRFLGYSVFETSRRGKYKRNVDAPQAELLATIRRVAPGFGEDFIEMQRNAIKTLIAPGYSGPLGIDMLATGDGRVNPCVEINLRMTMGLARLL